MNLLTLLGMASFIFVVVFTIRAYRNNTGSGQTPREAIIEAWSNIVIGFSANFLANLILLPLMMTGGHLSLAANFWGGCVFTGISMLRQYALRRFFERRVKEISRRIDKAISSLVHIFKHGRRRS